MESAMSIPIAGFKDVYGVSDLERTLQELPASANDALKSVHEKMIRAGGSRFTVKPSEPVLDALSQLGPREMRRIITSGFGNAKLAGREEMQASDVTENRAPRRQRIGF